MVASAEDESSAYDLARLVYFSDAVFAIVITLLVLPLTSDVGLSPGSDLASAVWDLWPRFVSFVLSFLVVGQFWVVHHRIYGLFVGCDRGLVWVSLVNLLTVCFVPFAAALLGEHLDTGGRFPVVFYAASLTLTSITFTTAWLYALSRGLVSERENHVRRAEVTTRAFVTNGVFLVSIGAAFFGLLPAVLCWVVLLPLVRKVVLRSAV
jgi:uncharacterized membrane protein